MLRSELGTESKKSAISELSSAFEQKTRLTNDKKRPLVEISAEESDEGEINTSTPFKKLKMAE